MYDSLTDCWGRYFLFCDSLLFLWLCLIWFSLVSIRGLVGTTEVTFSMVGLMWWLCFCDLTAKIAARLCRLLLFGWRNLHFFLILILSLSFPYAFYGDATTLKWNFSLSLFLLFLVSLATISLFSWGEFVAMRKFWSLREWLIWYQVHMMTSNRMYNLFTSSMVF